MCAEVHSPFKSYPNGSENYVFASIHHNSLKVIMEKLQQAKASHDKVAIISFDEMGLKRKNVWLLWHDKALRTTQKSFKLW